MQIPLTLVTTALNVVGKLVNSAKGGGNSGGGEKGSFKDAMEVTNLARMVADKLGPGDKAKIEKILADGDLPQALAALQGLLSSLFSQQQPACTNCAPATAGTNATAAASPTTGVTPGPWLRMNGKAIHKLEGITTNGDLAEVFGGTVTPKGAYLAAQMAAEQAQQAQVQQPAPTAQAENADALAALVGAGKTKPATEAVNAAVTTQAMPTAEATLAQAKVTMAPSLAAVPQTTTNNLDAIKGEATGLPGLATDNGELALNGVQVQNGGAGGADTQSSQENFFLLSALRKEAAGKSDAAAVQTPGDESFGNHLNPGLTYEAPKTLAAAQIDGALNPRVDTQKLIDQIMDGVFKPPVQLPKVVQLDLNPAHLGPLKVQVSMGDDGVRVQMLTGNPQVKAALEDGAGQLRSALANQGLALGQMDVRQEGGGRFAQQQQHQQRGVRSRFGGSLEEVALEGFEVGPRVETVRQAAAALGAVNAFA